VIMVIATFSTAMSAMYITSRVIGELARQRQAPLIFTYIDRNGRPIIALLCSFGIGLFAFLGSINQSTIVFTGVISFSGMSSIFIWASICLAHIRFRRGWTKQGHSPTELVFRSPLGTSGSWCGLCVTGAVLLSQLWTCIGPNAYIDSAAVELVGSFTIAYVYWPLLFILYTGYKLWHRTSLVRSNVMVFRFVDDSFLELNN
jgi:amino acid transporter